MQEPAFPENEDSRLETLRSLHVLDTPAEERFDRLTRLAKQLFHVPIAVVSLVDANRQWFKSCFGVDATETGRDISFCGHAILGEGIFLIPNATEDPRFSDNPLVTGPPHIHFYAGCPLSAADGSKLGTLCIIDTVARQLADDELTALKDLASMAEQELMAVQLATLDELTNISNRRGFISLAEKSLTLCHRQQINASLIFLDLNKFKQINDNFGHAEGDRALIAFATLLKQSFRESDIFARIGGDEFVVLLTGANNNLAKHVIKKFQLLLQAYSKASKLEYQLTFSYGLVSVDFESDYSIDSLLSQADSLMYENK
ncbi:GGDEF domain-containing protein [Methylophaga sp. 41_12_T18]|nr:GGDEF domain-containing protein [Methylophaga sp. 41_12_T18]